MNRTATATQKGNSHTIERIIYFDLETQKSAEEVGGWGNKHLMRVSVAVIYDAMEAKYKTFTEDGVEEVVQSLLSADLIVGFNVKRFDWDVLRAYSDVDFSKLRTVDLLEEVTRTLGHRLSLDHLARVTLEEGKIADGLQAIRWFREGNIEKLTEYCKHDVDITRRLHLFGKERGYVLFEHRQKGILRIPVDWA
jgi:DEAD/DEAH box helicase domain-containing protein